MARKPIVKKFGVDFDSSGSALTLDPSEVCDLPEGKITHNLEYSKTHSDGWTIKGVIHEDYYTWVNQFEATHPKLGRVWGDFETEVFATSEKAFQDFYSKHQPHAWDYGDI